MPQRLPAAALAPSQPSGLSQIIGAAKIQSFRMPGVGDRTTPVDYPEMPRQPLPTPQELNAMDIPALEATVAELRDRYAEVKARILEHPEYVTEASNRVNYNVRMNGIRGFQKALIAEQKLWDVYHTAFERMFDDLERAADPIAAMDAFVGSLPQPDVGTAWSNVRPTNFADERTIAAKKREADVSPNYQADDLAANLSRRLAVKRSAAFAAFKDLYEAQRDAIQRKVADVTYMRDLLMRISQINMMLPGRRMAAEEAQRARNAANEEARQANLARLQKFDTNTNRGEAIKAALAPITVERKPGFFVRLFTRKAQVAPLPRPATRTANVYRTRGYAPAPSAPPVPEQYRAPPVAALGVQPGKNRVTRRFLRGADDRTAIERQINAVRAQGGVAVPAKKWWQVWKGGRRSRRTNRTRHRGPVHKGTRKHK